jgi:[ribosomal protein S18]-alanine N-acetyltransferase
VHGGLQAAVAEEVIALRPATRADLERVAAIEREAGHERWDAQAFAAELGPERSRFWVAESAGEVVGFCVAWLVLDEAQLQNIGVAPREQRRGVGRALVARLVEEARRAGARWIDLEVREGNAAARALYGALGFVENGRRRRYYADTSEDAVLMRLAL